MPATLQELLGSDILLHYDASGTASLFTDTSGATPVSSSGDIVRCWKPEADAVLQVNLTQSTNAPAYTDNDNGNGLKAVVFDGVNDVLGNAATGLTTSQETFILAVFRYSGSAGTLWCRGSSAWVRGYCSTTSDGLQDSAGGPFPVSSPPSGRRCVCWAVRDGITEVNSLGYAAGARPADSLPASLNSALYLGALTGASQFGAFSMHEIMFVATTCEWGQVLRASTILRNKWGIADPNTLPPAPSSGSVIVVEDE